MLETGIDESLINALQSQRERMVLFQQEEAMRQFVLGTDMRMVAPTNLNGFQRLLVYRLAQRFGITHAQEVTETGERCIALYRTDSTAIPQLLVITSETSNRLKNLLLVETIRLLCPQQKRLASS